MSVLKENVEKIFKEMLTIENFEKNEGCFLKVKIIKE